MNKFLNHPSIYELALQHGLEYLDQVNDRHVFPTKKALEELSIFEEMLNDKPTEDLEVLNILNRYGAPATVNQLGGRYFGFVNGSAIPAGLAAKLLATFWDQNGAMQIMSPVASKLETSSREMADRFV